MIIESKAPTRVDFAGGTLDIWPLYLFHPGAVTVNAAISLYASCVIETHPSGDNRIKLGQYLFDCYGFWVVFLGRFVALLRILAAFLAGVNQMHWTHFFVANALGGVLWSAAFGFGGYWLGTMVFHYSGVIGPILFVAAVVAFLAGGYFIRRYETQLQAEADRAHPGPLR